MSIPIYEQETTINFSRDEINANLWTCDSTMITKLDKIYPRSKEHKDEDGNVWAVEYEMDKTLLSYRKAKRKGTPMTEEHKAKLRAGRETRTNIA